MSENVTLKCGMTACSDTVTHMDDKGFTYCASHGIERRNWRRCRKLLPFEKRLLLAGTPIYYEAERNRQIRRATAQFRQEGQDE